MQGLDPDLRALQEVRDLVARAKQACEAVHSYDQAAIDRLCKAMAEAGAAAAHELARVAVEETGIGRVHYKIQKNLLGSEGVWASIQGEKTVGIVRRDERAGILEVATPVGVIAAVIPTTNPTSTALYKALIAVKGRNAIVISPHPRAKRCIGETVEVMRRAIERSGGPPDLVCCLANPTIESTGALMKHKDVAVILATGGSGLVRAAYSSGKPAYGVGPGNVPAYVDRSADVEAAAKAIVSSQSFDNGTLCCSEQALVLDEPIAERMLAAMRARGAHVCNAEETEKLGRACNRDGIMNPDVVGLDPWRIAEMAGFAVPKHTSVLLAHQGGVGREWPLSIEILAPVLSVHTAKGWQAGCAVCKAILHYGGLGHTMTVWASDEAVLEAFFLEKPASRILANGPASQGAVGFSTNLVPSMSLGCGPQAGNITSDNISAKHLINLKRVAYLRRDWAELERRTHERAARWSGENAPRGSGLPGDPALAGGGGGRSAGPTPSSAGSNWMGNPTFVPSSRAPASNPNPRATPPLAARPASAPAARPSTPSPSFVRPSAPAPIESGSVAVATLARPTVARASSGVEIGQMLSVGDIQTLLQHAGSGCPLGPCKGCAHMDIRTSACTA